MKNNLYICLTYHHLLTAISKSLILNEKNDLILVDTIPEYKALSNNKILKEMFRTILIFQEKESKTNFDRNHYRFGLVFRYRKLCSVIKNSIIFDDTITFDNYNSVFLFNDKSMISLYLRYKKVNYILAEDAIDHFIQVKDYFFRNLSFFQIIKQTLIKFFYSHYYNLYNGDATSKYIKSIELNSKLPLKIYKSFIILNKIELFNSLSPQYKDRILSIFEINKQELLEVLKNRSVLLLTQPLYEDKYDKNKLIDLYKEIISNINIEHLVIKPHPRDVIDYKNIFKGVSLIEKNFPVELFNFLNIKFKKAITINSSSIQLLNNIEEKIVYGDEILKNILKVKS